jgi:hypothetical protein
LNFRSVSAARKNILAEPEPVLGAMLPGEVGMRLPREILGPPNWTLQMGQAYISLSFNYRGSLRCRGKQAHMHKLVCR